MTLVREHQTQFLECEDCPETTEPFDRNDFHEMIQSAKDAGWQIQQAGNGGWEHRCPTCRNGGGLARARSMFGG